MYWDPKSEILDGIKANGGWVNAHAHFDRAYTITRENFHLGMVDFQQKWALNNQIQQQSSESKIYDRMCRAVERMLEQNVQAVGTFIDINPVVKDKAMKAAQRVREKYKDDLVLKFINQTLNGVIEKEAKEWFDVAADFVDIIGGLPSKDKGKEQEHLDILLSTAKAQGKMVHVHVDQCNLPTEAETQLLIDRTLAHDMQGKVVAIHALSVAAHPLKYRQRIYRQLKDAQIMVVANPSAYIDDPRKEIMVPSHNSVTPVDELVPAGVTVAIGTDNIHDLHKPFTDGEMWLELRILLESCRFFDIDVLAKIATINGRKVLGIT